MAILDDEYTQNDVMDESVLHATPHLKANWVSSGKWALFLSILGFIITGLLALMAAIIGPTMQSMLNLMSGENPTMDLLQPLFRFITYFMVPVVALLFFIYLFHIRFANGIQKAMRYNDQDAFEAAWRNLRNYFRLYGIASLVVVVLYLVVMIFVLTTGSSVEPAIPSEF